MDFNLYDPDKKEVYLWEVLQRASSFLKSKGKDDHAAEWLFKELNDLSYTDLILKKQEKIDQETVLNFEKALKRVLEDVPPQYVIGHEWFYGRRFLVNEAVLIPRPETEELVAICLKEISEEKAARLIDIGTGSGVIGVTLALERPKLEVTATDISEKALTIAARNAKRLQAPLRFLPGDIFAPVQGERFDFIISNPPYISEAEWGVMDASVQKYEPDQALFAEEEGLAWYKKFAQEAPDYLTAEGMIFLEIGYKQGESVKLILEEAFPHRDVYIEKDLAEKNRFAIVK